MNISTNNVQIYFGAAGIGLMLYLSMRFPTIEIRSILTAIMIFLFAAIWGGLYQTYYKKNENQFKFYMGALILVFIVVLIAIWFSAVLYWWEWLNNPQCHYNHICINKL